MILALLALATAPIALPADLNQTVEVADRSYRVRVKGRVVRVFQKTVISKQNPERGVEMKRAVQLVTGCKMTEEFWQGPTLTGLLDCSVRPPAGPARANP